MSVPALRQFPSGDSLAFQPAHNLVAVQGEGDTGLSKTSCQVNEQPWSAGFIVACCSHMPRAVWEVNRGGVDIGAL